MATGGFTSRGVRSSNTSRKGDTDEALVFAEKRRKEDRGTSTCRNTGVETFLLYGEESINWTTKKLDS